MLLDTYNFFGFAPVEMEPSTCYTILSWSAVVLLLIYLIIRYKRK